NLECHVGAAREFGEVALPVREDLIFLAGIRSRTEWRAEVIENDRCGRESLRQSGQLWRLMKVVPGVERQPHIDQYGKTCPEIGIRIECGIVHSLAARKGFVFI